MSTTQQGVKESHQAMKTQLASLRAKAEASRTASEGTTEAPLSDPEATETRAKAERTLGAEGIVKTGCSGDCGACGKCMKALEKALGEGKVADPQVKKLIEEMLSDPSKAEAIAASLGEEKLEKLTQSLESGDVSKMEDAVKSLVSEFEGFRAQQESEAPTTPRNENPPGTGEREATKGEVVAEVAPQLRPPPLETPTPETAASPTAETTPSPHSIRTQVVQEKVEPPGPEIVAETKVSASNSPPAAPEERGSLKLSESPQRETLKEEPQKGAEPVARTKTEVIERVENRDHKTQGLKVQDLRAQEPKISLEPVTVHRGTEKPAPVQPTPVQPSRVQPAPVEPRRTDSMRRAVSREPARESQLEQRPRLKPQSLPHPETRQRLPQELSKQVTAEVVRKIAQVLKQLPHPSVSEKIPERIAPRLERLATAAVRAVESGSVTREAAQRLLIRSVTREVVQALGREQAIRVTQAAIQANSVATRMEALRAQAAMTRDLPRNYQELQRRTLERAAATLQPKDLPTLANRILNNQLLAQRLGAERVQALAARIEQTRLDTKVNGEPKRVTREETTKLIKEIRELGGREAVREVLKLAEERRAHSQLASDATRELRRITPELKPQEQIKVSTPVIDEALRRLQTLTPTLSRLPDPLQRIIALYLTQQPAHLRSAQDLASMIEELNSEWGERLKEIDLERLLEAGVQGIELKRKRRSSGRLVRYAPPPDRLERKRNQVTLNSSSPTDGMTAGTKISTRTQPQQKSSQQGPSADLIIDRVKAGERGDEDPLWEVYT